MIDFDLEIKNIQPINIKTMELNRYKVNENIIRSIILYNKAIAEIKTKDLDLAIMDLKKALSYNQGFAEGMKLLGLCYVNNKDYKKAEKTFKKLLKYEIYSELSKEYIKGLLSERNIPKIFRFIGRGKYSYNSGNKQSKITRDSRKKITIGFSILTIFITSSILIYWGLSALQTFSAKGEERSKIISSENKIHESIDLDENLPDVSYEEFENIQKELDNTKLQLDNYKNKFDMLLTLNEAEKSYKDGDYEKTASTLLEVKDMKFDDETKAKFQGLWADIKINGLWPIYNQGNRLYKEGKYQEALVNLKMVSEIDPNLDLMPWITYQIGTCYKEINDNTTALVFFQKVKDNYSQSTYASSAEMMINQIGYEKN